MTGKVETAPERLRQKRKFIRDLAEYLGGDTAKMSILVQMGDEHGKKWSKLYSSSGMRGWMDADEVERRLMELLG